MNPNNNLFNYATNELSQDAFLCWLFSHALKDSDNEFAIKACAIDFIKQFIPELENESEIWISEVPKKQYKSVDVLLTVNDAYKIIIEDKTYTDEHDNQLKRYNELVSKDFKDYKVIGIFFKIGFQSDLSEIYKQGYKYFGRKEILNTIERYINDSTNVIFLSYYEYIKNIDNNINSFKKIPVCEWNWAQINGFYSYLKEKIDTSGDMSCGYGYVANQSGGFYGMWFGNNSNYDYNGKAYELYLQCEFSNGDLKICYKASSKDKEKIRREVREYFVWREEEKWVNIAENNGFQKPSRYGCGKTVTLGFFDYDLENCNYKEAEKVINNAIQSFKKIIKELKLL